MSFSEILDVARKLTCVEKIRLMHELLNEIADTPEERWAATLGILPGTTFDVWFPQANEAAVAAAAKALQENRGM